ncbi:MAG TPA: glycosyltransferase, partial [Polyangiaceae bacterium]|nr:glycosyltransferase [Polyangiaceae bacterium]
DWAIAHAAAHRAHLVVVGDGPERERLEVLARERGADVRFVGRRPRRETLAWIAVADALVHASEAEGLSTVVREAETLGTRVIGP